MKVVIVAAGTGSRLTGALDSKPLIPLAGKPLVRHVMDSIIAAAPAGTLPDITLVTGWRPHLLETYVNRLPQDFGARVTTCFCPDWQKGNGASLLAARDNITGPFNVVMSDHIFEPALLERLNMMADSDMPVNLAVDYNLSNPLVDLDDVTRVECRDHAIVNIAKSLDRFNAFDTGCFYCTPQMFDALHQAARNKGDHGISGAVTLLAKQGKAHCIDVTGSSWIDVDTPQMFALARDMLTNQKTS